MSASASGAVAEIRRIAPAWVDDAEIRHMLSTTAKDPKKVKMCIEDWWSRANDGDAVNDLSRPQGRAMPQGPHGHPDAGRQRCDSNGREVTSNYSKPESIHQEGARTRGCQQPTNHLAIKSSFHVDASALTSTEAFMAWLDARHSSEVELMPKKKPLAGESQSEPTDKLNAEARRTREAKIRESLYTNAKDSGASWGDDCAAVRQPPRGYVPPEIARQLRAEAKQPWQRRYAAHLQEQQASKGNGVARSHYVPTLKRRDHVSGEGKNNCTSSKTERMCHKESAPRLTVEDPTLCRLSTEHVLQDSCQKSPFDKRRHSIITTVLQNYSFASRVGEVSSLALKCHKSANKNDAADVLMSQNTDGWRHGAWRGDVSTILRWLESRGYVTLADVRLDCNGIPNRDKTDTVTLVLGPEASVSTSSMAMVDVVGAVSYYYIESILKGNLTHSCHVKHASRPSVVPIRNLTILAVLAVAPQDMGHCLTMDAKVKIKRYDLKNSTEKSELRTAAVSRDRGLGANLLNMWTECVLTDVDLITSESVVRAHAAVLAAQSTLLESAQHKMVANHDAHVNEMPQGLEPVHPIQHMKRLIIDLRKYAFVTVQKLVKFLYVNDFDEDDSGLSQSVLCDLLECAVNFKIVDLFAACEDRLAQSVAGNDSSVLFATATKNDASQLLDSLITHHIKLARTPAGILTLHSAPKELITNNRINAALVDAVSPETLSPLMSLADKFEAADIRDACLRFSLQNSNRNEDKNDIKRLAASTSLGIEMLKAIAANKRAHVQAESAVSSFSASTDGGLRSDVSFRK